MFHKFNLTFDNGDGYTRRAVIALHDNVLNAVNDLRTPEEIASHLAYNHFINHLDLSSMDGFADLPDNYLDVILYPDLDVDWFCEATMA